MEDPPGSSSQDHRVGFLGINAVKRKDPFLLIIAHSVGCVDSYCPGKCKTKQELSDNKHVCIGTWQVRCGMVN